MLIVALGHRRNVGKDTVGKFILESLNLRHITFAGTLKDSAYKMFSWAGVEIRSYYENNYAEKETYLPILQMTYRELLIRLGNDMRKIHSEVWIRSAIPSAESLNASGHDGIVITDLRYPNEADVIQDIGGICIRIDRDVEKFSDVADSALESFGRWTGIFINDSPNLEHLKNHVKTGLVQDIRAYYGNA